MSRAHILSSGGSGWCLGPCTSLPLPSFSVTALTPLRSIPTAACLVLSHPTLAALAGFTSGKNSHSGKQNKAFKEVVWKRNLKGTYIVFIQFLRFKFQVFKYSFYHVCCRCTVCRRCTKGWTAGGQQGSHTAEQHPGRLRRSWRKRGMP